jgi:hypothetical protein
MNMKVSVVFGIIATAPTVVNLLGTIPETTLYNGLSSTNIWWLRWWLRSWLVK